MGIPYIDMHCDTLFRGHHYGEESIYNGVGQQSICQMCESGQMAQFYAVFFPPRDGGAQEFAPGCPPLPEDQEYFDLLRGQLLHLAQLHGDQFAMAHNYEELMANQAKGVSSAILTMEDGRLVNGSMEKLQELYAQDVRAIALTWNFANCFGAPNSVDPAVMATGLTDFGKEAVREMNRLGMLVDVSHLSDGGFYDVAKFSEKPFIASHSNCRALTDHPRNLTDDMIRILGETGSVAGLNLYSVFLREDPTSDVSRISDMVRHTKHLMDVGGEDCVGIGTDFDGMDCELEVGCPRELEKLFDALTRAGIHERQIDKIARGNVLRVIREAMR